jgi:hypothetical protein
MTIEAFTPVLWAGAILRHYQTKLVYVNCCNRTYEGDIKLMGDSVRVSSIGDPTILTITKNTDITAAEALQDSTEVLTISQHKGFNFQIDDVDKAQNKPEVMGEATKRAGYALAKTADIYVAGVIQGAVATANQLTPVTLGTGIGDGDAYETIVNLNVKLDENDVPEGMRWCVIPPWVRGLLQKDPRFTSFGTPGNVQNAENGYRAKDIDGLTIFVSNNVNGTTAGTVATSGGAYTVLAGSNDAVTFADQIPASGGVEAYRPHLRFADALKGHQLYGSLVQRPNSLASVVATQAST